MSADDPREHGDENTVTVPLLIFTAPDIDLDELYVQQMRTKALLWRLLEQ